VSLYSGECPHSVPENNFVVPATTVEKDGVGIAMHIYKIHTPSISKRLSISLPKKQL
jgi:hypothetical protein